MVVKLNDNKYKSKPFITKEAILNRYDSLQLFTLYAPKTIKSIGRPIISPLREEKNPSFSIFKGDDGQFYFKDHGANKQGDVFTFIGLLFNESFQEVLGRICVDVGLSDHYQHVWNESKAVPTETLYKDRKPKIINLNEIPTVDEMIEKKEISIDERDWEQYDIEYWNQFGIKLSTLRKYNVVPISAYYVHRGTDKRKYIADKLAYAFLENKDLKESYKIYQPHNIDGYKWRTVQDKSVWHGWTQLPKEGEMVILTKSLKDVMAIHDTAGIPAVSLQSESTIPKEHVIDELHRRFVNIYLLYDNDFDKTPNPGQVAASKIMEEYGDELGFCNLIIPIKYASKDFSDLYKNWGKSYAKKTLLELIEQVKEAPF